MMTFWKTSSQNYSSVDKNDSLPSLLRARPSTPFIWLFNKQNFERTRISSENSNPFSTKIYKIQNWSLNQNLIKTNLIMWSDWILSRWTGSDCKLKLPKLFYIIHTSTEFTLDTCTPAWKWRNQCCAKLVTTSESKSQNRQSLDQRLNPRHKEQAGWSQ